MLVERFEHQPPRLQEFASREPGSLAQARLPMQLGGDRPQAIDRSKKNEGVASVTGTSTLPSATLSDAGVITSQRYAAAYSSGRNNTVRFLRSRGCSAELAEETAQAAWVNGWVCRSKLREPEKVLNWVNTIAFNRFRSQFRTREFTVEAPTVPIEPQTGPGAIDAQRILERCSQEERALLMNHYVAGYSSKEIGRQLNYSAITVRVRLLRLRRRIQLSEAEDR